MPNPMIIALRTQRMGDHKPGEDAKDSPDEAKEGGMMQQLQDRVAQLEQEVQEIKKAYGMDKGEEDQEQPSGKPY